MRNLLYQNKHDYIWLLLNQHLILDAFESAGIAL